MTIKKYIFIFVTSLLAAVPASAAAATILLQATPATIGVGDTVRVDVLLNSAIATNAFSGTLSYSNSLEPTAISDGNSIISLWITHPSVPTAGTPVTFAGIVPGGFSGDNGVLFSVLFKVVGTGAAQVFLGNDLEVLRDDGKGGREPTSANALVLDISPTSSGGGYVEPVDRTPPEPFTISLASDPQLFGGRYYLVFMAVDKGSGMDHYAVAESRLPAFLSVFFPLTWSTTTSPYMLADQKLTSTVYIKAVDRAGNERLSVFPPRYFFTSYEWGALLVILIGVAFLWKIKRGRRSRKNS